MTAKEKYYNEGYEAYWGGDCISQNPYDCYLQEPQYDLWETGWIDSHDKDEGK